MDIHLSSLQEETLIDYLYDLHKSDKISWSETYMGGFTAEIRNEKSSFSLYASISEDALTRKYKCHVLLVSSERYNVCLKTNDTRLQEILNPLINTEENGNKFLKSIGLDITSQQRNEKISKLVEDYKKENKLLLKFKNLIKNFKK